MAKQTTAYELMLPLRSAGTPAYRWLYDALRGEILEGRLRPGARLPGTRDLGDQYGLSRGTIVNAFEQLKSEGYVEGSVGSGTYVSKILPEELLQVPRAVTQQASGRKQHRYLSNIGKRLKPFPAFELKPLRAFRANQPALDLFPMTL